MPSNIEIKVRLKDPDETLAAIKKRCPAEPEEICQEDHFFHIPHGRLKLRLLGEAKGELIQYHRTNSPDPKPSDYEIYSTADPRKLLSVLQRSLTEGPVVKKKRLLFLEGRTRVHFDYVVGLGHFLELEVVLREAEDVACGYKDADDWIEYLRIKKEDLIAVAYADLLLNDAL
jgi:predicted adenylyl cyclase CyaB